MIWEEEALRSAERSVRKKRYDRGAIGDYGGVTIRYSTRSLFLLILAAASAVAAVCGTTSVTSILGWIGIGIYLLLRGQRSLFWPHLAVPLFLGLAGLVLFPHGIPESPFSERVIEVGWLSVWLRYVALAGLGMSMMTLPLSLMGVDPK